MKPHLWIAYDCTSTSQCLSMLDMVLKQHPDCDIIHEISKSALVQAALDEVPIVSRFHQRLNNNQMLVADFKGYDVPCSTLWNTLWRFYYAFGADLVTVTASAPDEAVQEVINGANSKQKLVAFHLMPCFDDNWKVKRAQELADLGASLVICHMKSSEQLLGDASTALLAKVCHQLEDSSTQVIVAGDLNLGDVKDLKPYVEQAQIFAIAVGSAITQSKDPNAATAQFLAEINRLIPNATAKDSDPAKLQCDATWAAIDELTRCL